MVNQLHQRDPSDNVMLFEGLVCGLLSNNGEKYTITRLKAMRLVLQQYVLEQTVTPVPFAKADKDMFPKAISFLKPDLNDVYSIRYSLSVMRIIEEFRCKPDYDVSTITDPSTADYKLINEIRGYIRNWWFIQHMPDLKPTKLVLSNKAGPNGPATMSCLQDLTGLSKDMRLAGNIDELLSFSAPYLEHTMQYELPEGDFLNSKLVFLSDKACKTRIIAIADWWSNMALKPIHDGFMKAL